jgi:IS30 family transposase
MSYSHLTTFERGKLETLHFQGKSLREIGRELGRHPSTIGRELGRNKEKEPYKAEKAQEAYYKRREVSKPIGKYTSELAAIIQEKLQLTWSPEQIAGRMKTVSFKTMYRWIYSGLVETNSLQVLRQKGKRRKPSEKRGRFTVGKSIHSRPKEVKERTTFGNWELDTVVSSRGKSKACVATFAERKTRLYLAVKMSDRTATSMERAIGAVIQAFPQGTFKTATTDRGKEFACYPTVEAKHSVVMYFADPYSSWQRGTNENANGLLREFYPKRYDFHQVTEEDLATTLDLINHRPRKCLGWKSAYETFTEELSHLA